MPETTGHDLQKLETLLPRHQRSTDETLTLWRPGEAASACPPSCTQCPLPWHWEPAAQSNTQCKQTMHTTPSTDKQHPVQTHNTQYKQHLVQTHNTHCTQYKQCPVQTNNTQYRHTTPSIDNTQYRHTIPSTDTQHPVQTHKTQYSQTTPSTDNTQYRHTTPRTDTPVQTHQYRHTTPSSDTQHPVSPQTDTLLTQGRCLEHSMSWRLSFALNHLHLHQPSQLSRCFHAYLNKTECRFKLALKSEAILWLTWHSHLRKCVHRCWHKMLACYATAHWGCMGTVRKSLH